MEMDLVYASLTGNTEKIARTIARELKIKAVKVSKVKKLKYDLIIIGSPTHGMKPTGSIVDFIDQIEARYAAIFCTSGNISCVNWMEKKLENKNIRVIGRFSCPGQFSLFNLFTLNKGRPDINDVTEAKHFAKLIKKKLRNPRLRG